jgi:hypothetical protein
MGKLKSSENPYLHGRAVKHGDPSHTPTWNKIITEKHISNTTYISGKAMTYDIVNDTLARQLRR